jgi:hypothetical protein
MSDGMNMLAVIAIALFCAMLLGAMIGVGVGFWIGAIT